MSSITSTNNAFDRNSNDATGVSLCIPFVYSHVTKEKVFAVIKSQNVGFIERIDIVKKDEKHNRVFIHFARGKWGGYPYYNATDVLLNLKASIPWIVPYSKKGYWKIWISNRSRPEANTTVSQHVPRVRRKKCLELTADTLKDKFSSSVDLNDPIQARIYASMPIQCE
jgi:hypothetical protein